MPKRARETEETQDSAWIGRAAMLTPAAARGKRLPEAIVMKILRVTRGAGASKVLLEYDLNGVKKQYTDIFLSGTPLSMRYVAVAAHLTCPSQQVIANAPLAPAKSSNSSTWSGRNSSGWSSGKIMQ